MIGWKQSGCQGFFRQEIEFEDFSIAEDIQAYFSQLSAADISAFKAEIQELKPLTNSQQKSQEKTMSHLVAIGTLTAKAGAISLDFPPVGIAFGLFVLGAGLMARD